MTQDIVPVKQPGIPEPRGDRCSSRLHGWDDPTDPRFGRYCARPCGWGTPHKGEGKCKMHLGNTKQHIAKAERKEVVAVAKSMAERLGEPEPMGDPYVELVRLGSKFKQWEVIATEMMTDLDNMTTEDVHGVERVRALVELWERAADRASAAYAQLVKLGLMQHKAELEDSHAHLLYNIVARVLESPDVGLTDQQIATAKDILFSEIEKAGPHLTPSWFPDDLDDDQIFDAEVI